MAAKTMTTSEAVSALKDIVQRFVVPLQHLDGVLTAAQDAEHQKNALARETASLLKDRDALVAQRQAAEQAHAEKLAQMDVDAAQARDAETEHALKVRQQLEQDITTLTQRKQLAEAQAVEAETVSRQRVADAQAATKKAEGERDAMVQAIETLRAKHRL